MTERDGRGEAGHRENLVYCSFGFNLVTTPSKGAPFQKKYVIGNIEKYPSRTLA